MTEAEFNLRPEDYDNFDRTFNPAASEIKLNKVQDLYDWSHKNWPNLPQKNDFDISNHWKLAPNLYLIKRVAKGAYDYLINGEKVVEIMGKRQNGKLLTDDKGPRVIRYFVNYLDDLCEKNTSACCTGNLSLIDRKYINFESYDCPLIDQSGNITHIIGIIDLLPQKH